MRGQVVTWRKCEATRRKALARLSLPTMPCLQLGSTLDVRERPRAARTSIAAYLPSHIIRWNHSSHGRQLQHDYRHVDTGVTDRVVGVVVRLTTTQLAEMLALLIALLSPTGWLSYYCSCESEVTGRLSRVGESLQNDHEAAQPEWNCLRLPKRWPGLAGLVNSDDPSSESFRHQRRWM